VRLPLNPASAGASRVVVFVAQAYDAVKGADSAPLAAPLAALSPQVLR